MYAVSDNSGDSDGRSSDGDDLNVRPEPSAQLDPETTVGEKTQAGRQSVSGIARTKKEWSTAFPIVKKLCIQIRS